MFHSWQSQYTKTYNFA